MSGGVLIIIYTNTHIHAYIDTETNIRDARAVKQKNHLQFI